MSDALLTFAIPYYHDAEYLRRAIESVRAQTVDTWRVVVCDDASPDPGAEQIVADCGDPRISYVRNPENLGLAGNWNRCLELARTDLVTLLHSDDELLPSYAAAVIAAHRRHVTAAAVYPRVSIIDRAGRPVVSIPDLAKVLVAPPARRDVTIEGDRGLARLLRGSFIFCPSLCYRRSALGAARFDPRWRFVVDLDLLARLLLSGRQLVGIADVAYAYRRHEESETSRLTRGTERFEEELAIYDAIAQRASACGWPAAARVARRRRIVQLHLAFRVLADLLGGRREAAGAKSALLRGTFTRHRVTSH